MKGFTLIEVLVVIAISALLATMAFTYSSISRNQVALSVETSKVAESILRAKDLAVATYNKGAGVCAYGVFVDVADNRYSIFAFQPDDTKPAYGGPGSIPPCPSVASTTVAGITSSTEMAEYSPSSWNVPIANGVRLTDGGNGDTLVVALFYPPAPTTFLSRDAAAGTFLVPAATSKIYLVTADGSASTTISVNASGQVTF